MPIKVVDIEEFNDKVREEIIKAIAEHLDNYVDRSENGYNGIIKIIKLAKDSCVPNENVDEVNATSELIEKRREIEGSAKKGKGIQEIL